TLVRDPAIQPPLCAYTITGNGPVRPEGRYRSNSCSGPGPYETPVTMDEAGSADPSATGWRVVRVCSAAREVVGPRTRNAPVTTRTPPLPPRAPSPRAAA